MKIEIKQLIADLYNSPVFTAIAGSLTSLALPSDDKLPWYKKLAYLFVGTAICVYTSPVLIDWLGIENEKTKMGLTFLIGTGGVSIAHGVHKLFKMFKEDPANALKNIRNIWKK